MAALVRVAGLYAPSSTPSPLIEQKYCLSFHTRLHLRKQAVVSHCLNHRISSFTDRRTAASLVLNPGHGNRLRVPSNGRTLGRNKVQIIFEASAAARSNKHLEGSDEGPARLQILRDSDHDVTLKSGRLVADHTNLESNVEHRLWVAFATMEATAMMTKALILVCQHHFASLIHCFLHVAGGVVTGYVLADLGSGVLHWGLDNYGDATTPVFGPAIAAFQGHHQQPWTITKRQFANNVHLTAKAFGLLLLPMFLILLLPITTSAQIFSNSLFASLLGFAIMSQQFHAWAHMSKQSQVPDSVLVLQNMGVLVSRKMHGAHHKAPYDINYCIVSGLWNVVLDHLQIFKRWENLIYATTGVAPRSWGETSKEWMQQGTYYYFEEGTSDTDTDS